MEITTDLLQKYSSGKATSEEKAAIEQWLLATDLNQEEESFPLAENKEEVYEQIKLGLTQKIQRRSRKSILLDLRKEWRHYAVAASVLLTLWGLGFYYTNYTIADTQAHAFDNMKGRNSKSFRTSSGLVFTLAAHSWVEANTDTRKSTGSVYFCGMMEIKNDTDKAIKLVFSSNCKTKKASERMITCEPGKSYIALQDHIEESNIIIINRKKIYDLPGQIVI